jgi:hypothetical protein
MTRESGAPPLGKAVLNVLNKSSQHFKVVARQARHRDGWSTASGTVRMVQTPETPDENLSDTCMGVPWRQLWRSGSICKYVASLLSLLKIRNQEVEQHELAAEGEGPGGCLLPPGG